MWNFPRFPYGGTNRIRFKGYNLSRMAPPSKMFINAVGIIPDKIFCNFLQICCKSTTFLQKCNNYFFSTSLTLNILGQYLPVT